jgi:hypothetical protein
MYLKQYQLLQASWKAHFDFLSLKKIDHKDLSPFKLDYNKALFDLLFADQRRRKDRGKNKYQELAERIYNDIEKARFVRNKKGISIESMVAAIQESEIITGIHVKEDGGHRYPLLMVKCYMSTITLNDEEVTFFSTALPCHLDDDSGSVTVAIASIPIMKKSTTKKETKIFKWALRIATTQLQNYYSKVFDYTPPKINVKQKLLNFIEDIHIKYFM